MDEGKFKPLKVVPHPTADIRDVAARLRSLAESIERGEFGESVHNLAWVADCGDSRIEVGLIGVAAEPGSTAHFLLHCGALKLLLGGMKT